MSETHTKLINFMRAKAQLLPKYKRQYFTKADAGAIAKWSEEDAKEVLRKLVEGYDQKRLDSHWNYQDTASCVFCLKYYPECTFCEYGAKHGICCNGSGTDTYTKIGRSLSRGTAIADIVWSNKDLLIKIVQD